MTATILHISGSSLQCGPTPVKSPPTSFSLIFRLIFCDWSRSSSPTMTSSNRVSRSHRASLRIDRHAILFDFVVYPCWNSSTCICFSCPIKDSSTSVIDESSWPSIWTFSYLSWLVMLMNWRKKWRQRLENSKLKPEKTKRKGVLDYSEHNRKNIWSRRTCITSRSSAEVIPQETGDVWGHGHWSIGVFATISEISTQLCLGSVRCQMAGPVTALRWEPCLNSKWSG